jgi:hypothetical protein
MSRGIRILIALSLLPVPTLWGQALSGTIVGTVTDQADAVVAGARVVLTNEATQFSRVVESNPSGQYVAYSIPTGRYTITAEAQGFQKLVRTGVQLTAADTLTVDLKLTVGSLQQTVEVNAQAPLLQSQTATVSNLVNNEQILEMPLNGRTFTSLVLLAPGAHTGSSSNLGTGIYSMRADANISVNGSSAQNNSYLIDGIGNRNLWLNTLIMVPTVDSIQEFRVLTSNYSAEYGTSAGSVTVVQTRSGTNTFHGSAYEFLRNDHLDANTFFNNRLGATKPPFRRNEFGATAGGPIIRDKTFFFTDYQGIRIRQPQTITATIPTLNDRGMFATGDFSPISAQLYDPFSLHAGSGGTQVRDPFPGNRIPTSMIDPAAVKLIGLLPPPTSVAKTRNFVFNPVLSQRTDQFDVRLDQNLGASDRLFFKYSYDNTDLIKPGKLPAGPNPGVPVGPYVSATGDDNVIVPLRNQSATLNFTKVIGPSMVNETYLGVVRWNQNITPLDAPFNTSEAVGIKGININDKAGGLAAFQVTGYQTIGNSSSFPENSQTASFHYGNNLTVIRGSHTLKFGGTFVRHRFNGFSAFPTRGTYNFNGQFTRQVGASGSQGALADFALGTLSDVTRNILTGGGFGMRYWSLSGFADDSWRVNNRLAWNFGIRYELLAPPNEVHDHWSNFNVVTGRLLMAGRDGNSRTLRNLDTNNVAPRMGISYMLTSDRKTVLRTGFGVSYVEAGKGGGQLYKNLPFFFSQVISTDQNGKPVMRISDGLPAPTPPDMNDQAQLSAGNPTAWDFNLQSTRAMQWSFGIQREIVPDLLVDTSYVGTRTIGLISAYNPNQTFPGAGAQGPRRPLYAINPLVGNITYNTNYGSSKYHSLQVRAEKRASHGLSLALSYTWAKYLSNGGNLNGGGNGPPQDARCFNCEWGPYPDDRRHILVLNHVYELPFGYGRQYVNRGVLAYIVGNWKVSGIWTASTGEHFTAGLAAAVSNSTGGSGDRPNRLRDGNLPSGERTIDRWFDVSAFASPAQFSFGNSGRGILVAPGNFNVDLGVHRDFRVTERYRLVYRWEMFNAFNRANFGTPNASIGNSLAGQISGTGAARIMQMALKFAL